MTEPLDFRTRLRNAAASARNHLSGGGPGFEGYNPTDKRAAAYHEIATVLLEESLRTGNANYEAAARMLQEQAEITTYSGPSGVGALVGNMNALLQSRGYNIPLDYFSWRIDDAVVRFFEEVSTRGMLWEINQNNILAVDGLVWDSFGLIDYFPGNALGYDYDAPAGTSLWANASPGQYERLAGKTYNALSLIGYGVAEIALAATWGAWLTKTPDYYGFSTAEISALQPGQSIGRRLTNGVGWTAERDQYGVVRIRDDTGLDGYYSNDIGIIGFVESLGQIIVRNFSSGQILEGYGSWVVNPDGETFYFQPDPLARDRFLDRLGADHGPGGLRVRYNGGQVGEVRTQEDLFNLFNGIGGPPPPGLFAPAVQVIENPDNSITIYGRRTVNGQEQVVSMQVRENSDGGLDVERQIVANVDVDGNLTGVSDADATMLLNLESLAQSKAALEAFLRDSAPRLEVDIEGLLEWDTKVTGAQRPDPLEHSFLTATMDANGNLTLTGFKVRKISYDPRTRQGQYAITTGVDEFGREVSQDWVYSGVDGARSDTGIRRVQDGVVEIFSRDGEPTTIRLLNSPTGIDFVNAAETITSVLGRHFIGGNALVQTITSASLQTLASNFGDILNTAVFDSGVATTKNMGQAFDGMDAEFLNNLRASGVSAIGAYLTAELVGALGVSGFAGEASNSIAGSAVNQIVSNLAELALGNSDVTSVFQGVGDIAQLGNVAGSFLGNHLASKIGDWDEIGEQLGSSIGGTLGGIVGQTLIPIPVLGAIVGSFLGNLLGGLIGGVFTGTPKSGAILGFDESTGLFAVKQVWKDDDGQKRAAQELGSAAADALNGIVTFIGGDLVNGDEIEAGSYGLRGKRYVYWEDGTQSDNRIKFKEAEDLIEFGVLKAIKDFEFRGGDVYAKRAFHATLATAGLQETSAESGGAEAFAGQLFDAQSITTMEFTLDALLGNFAVVERLHHYLESPGIVNALIAAEPDSVFTADWMLAFTRMEELGLWRRSTHDWDGGFAYLLGEAQIEARDVQFTYDLFGDGLNGERVTYLGPWFLSDTVDSGSKTVVLGGAEDDRLFGALAGPGHIANVIRGGAGDDEITGAASGDDLFGAAGDDRLTGGVLDDWLFGGGGNDVLDAGGGNGNVLSGDAGDDFVTGADRPVGATDGGSDWLAGGFGDDVINGRGGDDFIEGGADHDRIDGGAGNDTIIFRSGDGVDHVADTGTSIGEHDVLEFGREVRTSAATVVARSSGEALSVFLASETGGGRLDLRGLAYGERGGVDELRFGDQDWSRGDVTARAVFSKTAGSAIFGTTADEALSGTIHDDSLTGGGGADSLSGGLGSDVYTFNLGDGVVSIDEDGFSADLDVLVFGAGITLADIVVDHDPEASRDITLTVGTAGDKIVLLHQALDNAKASIEEIRFADGTSLTMRDLQAIHLAPPFTGAADTKRGFDANDNFYGGDGNDVLAGGAGIDNLEGQHGADTYVYRSGDGHDRIYDIGHYNSATAGDRLVLGTGLTLDLLRFDRDAADGNNLRVSFTDRLGSIMLDDQFVSGNSGVETIELADGTIVSRQQMIDFAVAQSSSAKGDFIAGDYGFNAIAAGAGDDRVQGGDGDDTITGGLGADSLEGGHGADTYHYALGDGADWIHDVGHYNNYTAGDTLRFGEGIAAGSLIIQREWLDARNVRIAFAAAGDSILLEDEFDGGAATIDLLAFADGTTWDRAALAAASVAHDTSAEADRIVGWHGADVIAAGGGHDRVYGWEGDDTITGGAGNDDLQGGHGADSYHYAIGDGHDTIWDQGYHNSYTPGDRLVLGAGIAASDLILERDQATGLNLRIRISGQTGSILLDNQFDYGNGAVDSIVFADGTTWDRAAIAAEAIADAVTAEADFIEGSHEANAISGLGGNDRIYGWDGDDTIAGGTGDDIMEGGAGADVYVYAAGDGHDRIYDLGHHNSPTPGDKLVFGAGIAATDITLSRDSADSRNLIVRLAGMAGSVLIDDQFIDANGGVESFVFADGTTWSRAVIEAAAPAQVANAIAGTEAANTLSGTAGADVITTLGGNDSLSGGAGADRLEGGQGNDIYHFGLGDGWDYANDAGGAADILRFGAGIDADDVIVSRRTSDNDASGVVFSIAGTDDSIYFASFDYEHYGNDRDVESVEFADGTVWNTQTIRTKLFSNSTTGDDVINGTTLGHNVLVGGAGHDRITSEYGGATIAGGTGNDRLNGGSGNDLYHYALGDGIDTINDQGGSDILRFGGGIEANDIIVSRRVADEEWGIVISILGTNDHIYLMSANYNRYGSNHAIERIEFADGTVLTDADLRTRLMGESATGGDDFIIGSTWNDVVAGGAGDDQLRTFEGDDRLSGGTGNDLLEGSSGDDTYVFNAGDGRDTIVETGGNDRIEFGAGISAADVVVRARVGDWDEYGIVFSIGAGGDELHVTGANYNLYGSDKAIEAIVFADGTVWTDADVRAKLFAGKTSQGDDFIQGSTFSGDLLVGGGGDDRLIGDEGNDTLNGGKGDDRLEGGNGNDLYLFERGDGYEVVNESGGNADIMRFGSGVVEGDIRVNRKIGDGDTTGVVFSITGTRDQIYVVSWDYREYGNDRDMERVEFADGTFWTPETVTKMLSGTTIAGAALAVSMGSDDIVGSAGADTIRGMHGDDFIRGGAGSDTYVFARGDGHDTIHDPVDAAGFDRLELEGLNSADVTVLTSPADADDVVIFIDDENIIHLDQQKAGVGAGIDEVVFANGETWTRAMLLDRAAASPATTGDDNLLGTNFAETLAGGLGNDILRGRAGADTYIYNVGDGDDVIDERESGTSGGASGAGDTIAFGAGIALIDLRLAHGAAGDLLLSFASMPGLILLKGQEVGRDGGVETLSFADGSTVTIESLRQSFLNALVTTGDDTITGFGRADILFGGAGVDTLIGGDGGDTYRFAAGDGIDTIVEAGATGFDALELATGIAVGDVRLLRLAAAPGDLILALANGTDRIVLRDQLGGNGIDSVRFADGTAWTRDELVARLLAQPGTAEGDYLAGDAAANSFDGLAGDDIIDGGDGDDVLAGGLGADSMFGGRGADTITGGDGDDLISGGTGHDQLDGGAGTDTVDFGFSRDSWTIDLTAGTALITGGVPGSMETITSFESVIGGIAADQISGDTGANRLRGAEGDDQMAGGDGDDVFVVDGTEDGFDRVDGGAGADRIEALSAGTVIGLTGVAGVETITANGHADVIIGGTEGNDSLDLAGAQLVGIASIQLSTGDDLLVSALGADTIDGGDGNDTIRYTGVSSGGDAVDGGEGQDRIAAGSDYAVIRLRSFTSVETLTGAGFAGVVVAGTAAAEDFNLASMLVEDIARFDLEGGADSFTGTVGADRVSGGAGDDTLAGGAGGDRFEFDSPDSGLDTIDGGAGTDMLAATADGAVIGLRSLAGVEAISGDGHAGVEIRLTDAADTLDLTAIAVSGIAGIRAGGGNDIVRGSAGDDVFRVSGTADGFDDLEGGGGADRLEAGADGTILGVKRLISVEQVNAGGYAGVTLAGTAEADVLDLRAVTLDGITRISLGGGADTVEGSAGADTLAGGTGNDRLSGNQGDDSYIFNLGDGKDVISEQGPGGIGGGTDILYLGTGISASDVVVTKTNGDQDFLLTIGSGAETVLITNGAAETAAFWLEEIRFADGTVWTREGLSALLSNYTPGEDTLVGTTGPDIIRGGGGNDNFDGKGGDDFLIGGTGNDLMSGGVGNDKLVGGTDNDQLSGDGGNDTYLFARGDGQDTIVDYSGKGGWGGNDTIQFADGIDPDDVMVAQANNGNDLVLTIAGGDSITVRSTVTDGDNRIEQVTFADGTVWSHAELMTRATAATEGADIFYGSYNSETIVAGAGNDTIYGRDGNDTIVGGTGNDQLSGDGGNDTYLFAHGHGQDTIVEYSGKGGWGGTDTVQYTADIAPEDVTVSQANGGNDLVLTIAGGDSITIRGGITDGDNRIEQVNFTDGTAWNHAELMTRATTPTDGADVFHGSYNGEVLLAGAGNDAIYGRDGNDTIVGGTGNDQLSGDGGNDTYLFARGDGQDTITDYSGKGGWGGTDSIQLAADIAPGDVTVTKVNNGNDLLLTIVGGDSIAIRGTVTNGDNRIEQVTFADGTVWTHATLMLYASATDGPDTLNGTVATDWLYGRGGDDLISGMAAADHLFGGAGNDTLTGGDEDDVLVGGRASDSLSGDTGNDLLIGDDEAGALDSDGSYAPTGSNLLVNGSFEQATQTNGSGSWGRSVVSMPGWTKTNTQGVEQVYSGFGGIAATDGSYWLDTDGGGGNGSNIDISQVVSGLSAGQRMVLKFDHSNYTSAESGSFEVYWNGALIASISETGKTMRTKTFELTAGSEDNVLRFRGIGSQENSGSALDNVRLFASEFVPANNDDVLSGGIGDDVLVGGAGNDTLNGGDGVDTARFRGSHSDYQLSTVDGVLTVTDLNPGLDGDDGVDSLTGIEALQFQNIAVFLAAPIVLDLDGNGVQLLNQSQSNAHFDMDGDGSRDVTSWIGRGNGLLALDRNGDGVINGINEISFVGDKAGATSDLDGLGAFDTNGDGILSGGDIGFAEFLVWHDRNGDGIAGDGELRSLIDAGIVSIGLAGAPVSESWNWNGGSILNTGSFIRQDGSTGSFADVALSYQPSAAAMTETAAARLVEASAAFRPLSSGLINDLRNGMAHIPVQDLLSCDERALNGRAGMP